MTYPSRVHDVFEWSNLQKVDTDLAVSYTRIDVSYPCRILQKKIKLKYSYYIAPCPSEMQTEDLKSVWSLWTSRTTRDK